jgi:phosphopantothenoylcysteine synthetase/decarboxylase
MNPVSTEPFKNVSFSRTCNKNDLLVVTPLTLNSLRALVNLAAASRRVLAFAVIFSNRES